MQAPELAATIDDPSPQGIASAVSMLIRTGELQAGARLPTVRSLAAALLVSPATVSHAWQGLIDAGMIRPRGRAGTFVLEAPTPWLTPRSRDLAHRGSLAPTDLQLDLSTNVPDPLLLPDITASLERVAPKRAAVSSYLQPPLLPELEAPLRQRWPYDVQALSIVDGAMDGVDRALRSVTRFGDRVIVENPTFPLLLDLLEFLHLRAVPVPIDGQGMIPQGLEDALASRPAAMFLQPRAHNPTGVSMTPTRAKELANVLATHRYGSSTVVIEDDHSGAISAAPAVSLGTWLPHQVLHVIGFSKSHGPDLRLGALGGPQKAMERIVGYRVLGPGWSSRMMQALLHDLLTSRESIRAVEVARHAYYSRQRELAACLRSQGIEMPPADGLNIWLPVADEQRARTVLAAHGIRVAVGSAFRVRTEQGPERPAADGHVRVSLGLLRQGIPEVASALAAAARETAS